VFSLIMTATDRQELEKTVVYEAEKAKRDIRGSSRKTSSRG